MPVSDQEALASATQSAIRSGRIIAVNSEGVKQDSFAATANATIKQTFTQRHARAYRSIIKGSLVKRSWQH